MEGIENENQAAATGNQPVMVPIMLMNQSGQMQGQLNQGQMMVLTQPNVQLIPSVAGSPSTWTIGSGMPSSVPSPVTPSGKNYKQTFFDNDVELIREAMKKLTKHVNSVSRISKVDANVKFYSEFQSRVKKYVYLFLLNHRNVSQKNCEYWSQT